MMYLSDVSIILLMKMLVPLAKVKDTVLIRGWLATLDLGSHSIHGLVTHVVHSWMFQGIDGLAILQAGLRHDV